LVVDLARMKVLRNNRKIWMGKNMTWRCGLNLLGLYRVNWRTLVNTVMNFCVS